MWQADALGRFDRGPPTPLAEAFEAAGMIADGTTLPTGQCRGSLRTDKSGGYAAYTEVDPIRRNKHHHRPSLFLDKWKCSSWSVVLGASFGVSRFVFF
jgi:protocatechuate 3,4-dioxygenase beta subunit